MSERRSIQTCVESLQLDGPLDLAIEVLLKAKADHAALEGQLVLRLSTSYDCVEVELMQVRPQTDREMKEAEDKRKRYLQAQLEILKAELGEA